jgi:hypothetical protein
MKYASFIYTTSSNLGDQIQSLAMEQFLPSIDAKFDRDYLSEVTNKEKHLLIMQGWFSHFPDKCFPPSDTITPVFFGFHITDWNESIEYFLKPLSVDYLKQHEPIGCRDKKTMEMLIEKGVDAFHSKCLTLTFPKRLKEPKQGKVFVVDVEKEILPEIISRNAVYISHIVNPIWGEEIKSLMAIKLLNLYRENASLVITKRLHCALPCIAMGIPVIFFGDANDYRVSIIKDLGLPIYPLPDKNKKNIPKNTSRFPFFRNVGKYNKKIINSSINDINWNPLAIDFEKEKSIIIEKVKDRIESVINDI